MAQSFKQLQIILNQIALINESCFFSLIDFFLRGVIIFFEVFELFQGLSLYLQSIRVQGTVGLPDETLKGFRLQQKFNMSKQKFLATNRQRFTHQKTQQFASHELKKDHKSVQKPVRQLLIPIEQTLGKKFQLASKPLKSEGKSSQRESKMPVFELLNFKDSLLFKKSKDTFNLKNLTRKRTTTNRVNTEKIVQPTYSAEKKASLHKILIRGGGASKQASPERNNYFKQQSEKIWATEKVMEPQIKSFRDSPAKSMEKKLTSFQKDEVKQYQIFYIGSRRITSLQDFTDPEGDPKVSIGDAIAYKYEIISVLGRGSFGRVYRAFDHKKKEVIALKIIKNQEKFNIQAKVQVQILETALLHDPKLRNNVVRLKGSFIFRGHTCLKFQLLSKNLYEFIKQTNFMGFSTDLIRRFAIQILQALHFFSRHQIVHCDLKPQNILLKQENKSGIKVIDVGSGCFEGKQIYTYIQSRFYRAPQIILGVKYTTAIDMWSFGCILIELYTGIPLFPGQNENQQMLMFIQLLGIPPRTVLERAERRKKFFTEDFAVKIPNIKNKDKIRESMSWKAIMGPDCDKGFLSLIKRCLEWEPNLRLTPKEGLLHQWIISGLPHTIRSQHVEQLNND